MKQLVYGLTFAALLSIAAPAWTQSQSNPPPESAPSTTTPAQPTTPLKIPENVTSSAPGRPDQAATPTDAPPASEKAGTSTHPAAAESKFPWEAGTALGTIVLALGTLYFMRRQTEDAAKTAKAQRDALDQQRNALDQQRNALDQQRNALDQEQHMRQRQATLEYWVKSREMYYQNYGELIAGSQVSDQHNSLKVREYLGMLEVFALGVNSELFDFETAQHLAGGFIVRTGKRFDGYIQQAHKRTEGRAYSELLKLRCRLVTEMNDPTALKDLEQTALP